MSDSDVEPTFAIYLKEAEVSQYPRAPLEMTDAEIAQFTSYAMYPGDWMRYLRMCAGGPPALMR